MEAVLNDPESRIQGFLAAGHVMTIMGFEEYFPIAEKYNVPIVVTGFEPVDLLQGILRVVQQLEKGIAQVENQYGRVARDHGNISAREIIEKVFKIDNRVWRGIGEIPLSGYELNDDYTNYDASLKFKTNVVLADENVLCIAGEVLKGIKKPHQCSAFGKECSPESPLGAPMVSSEGACAAYYHYSVSEI